jgi:DNA-binding response OmpR family regulator
MSRRVIAYVSDLMFSSRIEATLHPEGYEVAIVEDLPSLDAALAREPAALLILDLHAGATPDEVISRARDAGVPVLAFGRHTEPALLRSAREAGAVESVPRSTFVEEMTSLVQRIALQSPQESGEPDG